MNAAVSAEVTEVLDAERRNTPALPAPGETVIDANTGTITFERKSPSLLLAEAVAVHTEASDLAPLIDSDLMYAEAGGLLKTITDSFKTLDEERLATTLPLRNMVAEINDSYTPAIAKRKEASEILKRGMLAYQQAQEEKRRKAEAEARARAEEERRRAEAEARAARQRAEQEAAAARAAAEEKAAAERTQAEERAAAMRREADELEAAGNDARAAQLRAEANDLLGIANEVAQTALFEGETLAQAAEADGELQAESHTAVSQMITPAAVAIAAPKTAGVSTRKVYSAEILDAKALIAHVLANWDALNHLVSIETTKVNKLAADQKERFNLPGCELRTSNAIAARRR